MGFQGGNVGFESQAQSDDGVNLRDRSLESVVRMWLKFNETKAVPVQQTTRVVEPADQARVKQLENTVHGVCAAIAALNDRLTRLEMRLFSVNTPWVPSKSPTCAVPPVITGAAAQQNHLSA